MKQAFVVIVLGGLIIASGFRAYQMFKNAYDIWKIIRTESPKDIKITCIRQVATGLLYLLAIWYFFSEMIKALNSTPAP